MNKAARDQKIIEEAKRRFQECAWQAGKVYRALDDMETVWRGERWPSDKARA